MSEDEYYDLPYGVADRMELQNFLIADHYEGIGKSEARFAQYEPMSLAEIIDIEMTPVIGHLI